VKRGQINPINKNICHVTSINNGVVSQLVSPALSNVTPERPSVRTLTHPVWTLESDDLNSVQK
jgi:hypothetical protein